MNRHVARDLVLVPLAIAVVTIAALLVLGGAHPGAPAGPGHAVAVPAHADVAVGSPVALGKHVFETKGCATCHTVDGTARVGPSLLHDYGSVATLADGRTITVDDAYVRESIAEPQAKARPGYPAVMPRFDLRTRELDGVVAYIASLR
jgi:cytochrome c oxidase subunit 2